MKVRELLAQFGSENPDAEVQPTTDNGGNVKLSVIPPGQSFGESMIGNAEVERVLGDHLPRVERIRMAIGAFYGLPLAFKIHENEYSTWVELVVKSPTGMRMAEVDLSVGYTMEKQSFGWQKDLVQMNGPHKRFKEVPPDLAGYKCDVHKYVLTGDKLRQALKCLCEAPKAIEMEVG